MATNEKTAKESKAVAKPAPSKTVKPVDKEVVAAVRDTADNVAKVYSAIYVTSRKELNEKLKTALQAVAMDEYVAPQKLTVAAWLHEW